MSARSMQAIERVTQFCETYFKNMFELDIIDIYKHPQLAVERGIVCSPSLIKQYPQPRKVIIGDFSRVDNLMRTLGVPYTEE
jgi:circadian clock protein KaiB